MSSTINDNLYRYYISGRYIAILEWHEELGAWLTPTEDETDAIMVKYHKQAATVTDATDSIDVDDRIARALVYYVKMRLAEDRERLDLAQRFKAMFLENIARSQNNKTGTPGRKHIPSGVGVLKK